MHLRNVQAPAGRCDGEVLSAPHAAVFLRTAPPEVRRSGPQELEPAALTYVVPPDWLCVAEASVAEADQGWFVPGTESPFMPASGSSEIGLRLSRIGFAINNKKGSCYFC